MALPIIPKKEPKPIAVSFRLSRTAVDCLKKLSEAHNLSQADVIEYLVKQEYKTFQEKKK